MYDNKIRLSPDVLEKAELIAQEWGLKNARAAVEAVFRRYADEYLGRRLPAEPETRAEPPRSRSGEASNRPPSQPFPPPQPPNCEALNALDELLGL